MSQSTFTYSADRALIRRVGQSQMTPRLRRLNLVVAGLAGLTGFAIVGRYPWLALIGAILCLAGVFVMSKEQRPIRQAMMAMRTQFDALPEPKQITATVDSERLRLDNGLGAQDVPWSQVASVHQTRALWWVHTLDGTSLPLPAAAIPPDAAAIITAAAPKMTTGM